MMTMRRLFETHRVPFELTITERWQTIPDNAIPESDRELYLKRKTAVDLYLNTTTSIPEITQHTSIVRQELHRFVLRCVQLDEDGQPWGYRALIPRVHINGYTRRQEPDGPDQFAGAFKQLLDKYPEIKKEIDEAYLGKNKNKPMDRVISLKQLHKKFIDACKLARIGLTEYPFNTRYLAKRSLERYARELELQRAAEAVWRHGEDASRHMHRTGQGSKNRTTVTPSYRTVQFDGHKIDGEFTIIFTTPRGDQQIEVMHRLWYLAVLDVGSRSILGYHISFNREYNSEDVLHTFKNAIVPWTPRAFATPGLTYPKIGGFPSSVASETQWAVWAELMMDNGKANTSAIVMDRLTSTIGCAVNLGPVATPELRGILERTFRTIEEDGTHRFSNTTGSSPDDPRRKDPSGQAIKFEITYEHLLDIVEIATYVYNGKPHDALFHLSPLDVIKQHVMREENIRVLPEEKRMYVDEVLIEATRKVQGKLKEGRRPYIQFEGAVYRSDILANNYSLVGKSLTLLVNPDDIRVLKAFLNGRPIGSLIVTGKWAVRPHSLEFRRYINRLKYRGLIQFAMSDDPFEAMERHLMENAVHSKSGRSKLAKLQQEQVRWLEELETARAATLSQGSLFEDEDDNITNAAKDDEDVFDPAELIKESKENRRERVVRKTIIR